MALFAPRPPALHPFPNTRIMRPGPLQRRNTPDTYCPPCSSDPTPRSGLEREVSPCTLPKRPRLSTPSGHRNLLSDEADPSTRMDHPPMQGRNLVEPPHTAPLRLPSFSTILAGGDPHAHGTSSDSADVNEFGGARERLRRLTIGPSSFHRPLPLGAQQPTSGRSSKGRLDDGDAGPSTAPLITSQNTREISRSGSRSPQRATIDDRRRKRHWWGGDRLFRAEDGIEDPARVSRTPITLPPMHPETPRASIPPPPVSDSHSHQTSRVPPSEAWFSPAAPPSAWLRANWRKDKQAAYEMGFEDAIRSVESGIIGLRGQQYRNPTLVIREIPPAQGSRAATAGLARPSRPSEPPPYSPQRPQTAQLPARNVHWPHHEDHKDHLRADGFFPDSGPSTPRHTGFNLSHRPSQSLTRGYTLPPLSQLQSFSLSPESTSPKRGSIPSSKYSSSPSGDSITTLPRGPGPGRGHRQLISCYPCRAKKLKCDGIKPCSQCIRRNEVDNCAFAELIKRRGKARRREDDGSGSQSHSPDHRVGDGMLRDVMVAKVERVDEEDGRYGGERMALDGESSSAGHTR